MNYSIDDEIRNGTKKSRLSLVIEERTKNVDLYRSYCLAVSSTCSQFKSENRSRNIYARYTLHLFVFPTQVHVRTAGLLLLATSKKYMCAVNFASHVSVTTLVFTIEFILFAKTHILVQNYSAVGAEDEATSSTTSLHTSRTHVLVQNYSAVGAEDGAESSAISPHTSRTWMGKPKV